MSDYINLPGYASPENLWHKNANLLLGKKVIVEEKIDGSQFSFGVMQDGKLHFRSKGRQIQRDDVDGLFEPIVWALIAIEHHLPVGLIFRAEAVTRKRHNVLTYERVPERCCVVYDIQNESGQWMLPGRKVDICLQLGLECVGFEVLDKLVAYDFLADRMNQPSMLGGPREGIVIKPYDYLPLDPYTQMPVMAKMVRNEFREKHGVAGNPNGRKGPSQIIERLTTEFATEARWQKAVQHLRDRGELKEGMHAVPDIMREIVVDLEKEEELYIRDQLWKWAWPQLKRLCGKGAPEWYKSQLIVENKL